MNPVCLVCGDVPAIVTYPGTPEYYCHPCWAVLGDVPSDAGYVPTGMVWELDCAPSDTGYVLGGYTDESGYVPGDARWDRVPDGGYADGTGYVPSGIGDVPSDTGYVLGGYADEPEYVPSDAEYVPSDAEWDRVSEDAYPLVDVGYVLAR